MRLPVFEIFRRSTSRSDPGLEVYPPLDLDEMLAEDTTPMGGLSKAAAKKFREARKPSAPAVMTIRSSDRLPPGQHLVTSFPVLDIGILPTITTDGWRLDVRGEVGEATSFEWAALMAMEPTEAVSDFHCVTGWSRFDNRWNGVATTTLARLYQPTKAARFVLLHGADGYTTNLPLDDFLHPAAMLATHWNGRPLEPSHGGPVRVVVPHLYGWKSAKWVVGIELLAEQKSGFWEVGGYHDRGDPWMGHRFKWNDASYSPW